MKRKDEVVDATTKGVAFLFRKNKIASFQGTGRIEKAGSVAVLGDDGAVKDTLAAKNILIASGSEVIAAAGRRPSTRRRSSPRPARSSSPRCPSAWSWSAPASSASSWARCGAGSARR